MQKQDSINSCLLIPSSPKQKPQQWTTKAEARFRERSQAWDVKEDVLRADAKQS